MCSNRCLDHSIVIGLRKDQKMDRNSPGAVISRWTLFIAFITLLTLKLSGVVAWSWWIILIPLYPTILTFVLCFCAGIILGGMGYNSREMTDIMSGKKRL